MQLKDKPVRNWEDEQVKRSEEKTQTVTPPDQPYRVGPEQMETLFDDTDQATCMMTTSDINIDQALNGPEKMQWQHAINREMAGLKEKITFGDEPVRCWGQQLSCAIARQVGDSLLWVSHITM